MKVLHINCVYPQGSTGKITQAIHRHLLCRGQDSLVIYGRGGRCEDPAAVRICGDLPAKANHALSRVTGLVYGGCHISTGRLIARIRREKPDIVHIQCINGYFVNIYRLISWLKEQGIRTVLTLHAEFMYTANCGCAFDCEGWKHGCGHCPQLRQATESLFFDRTADSFEKMRKAFHGFGDRLRVVGVSDWLCGRAAQAPVLRDLRILRIHNGIDTSVFCPQDADTIRRELGIRANEKMVLWVTSGFTHAKGKDLFFDLVKRLDGGDYKFVIAGADRPSGDETDVIYLGSVADQTRLARIYSAADVTVCCSRQESYPTTLLESQCCGTPVVGFRIGGVPETVFPGMGQTVPMGDIEAMAAAVAHWCGEESRISAETREDCLRANDQRTMADAYFQLYSTSWSEHDDSI